MDPQSGGVWRHLRTPELNNNRWLSVCEQDRKEDRKEDRKGQWVTGRECGGAAHNFPSRASSRLWSHNYHLFSEHFHDELPKKINKTVLIYLSLHFVTVILEALVKHLPRGQFITHRPKQCDVLETKSLPLNFLIPHLSSDNSSWKFLSEPIRSAVYNGNY